MEQFFSDDLAEDVLSDSFAHVCQSCSANMKYKGSGRFVCEKCGEEYLTDFGKIKRYLEENGPQNAVMISRETGVSRWKISKYLQMGRMEVAQESGTYLFCESCGVAIRSGKYCTECTNKMAAKSNKGFFTGDLDKKKQQKGEMRFGKEERKK